MHTVIESISTALCWFGFGYKWLIIIAILMTWVNADPYNPFVQNVNKLTLPFWEWCHRWLPRPLKNFNAYISLLVVMFFQALIPASLLSLNLLLHGDASSIDMLTQLSGHLIQSTTLIFQNILTFFMILMIAWFFITMVSPSFNNPIVRIVYVLVDPLLAPIRRYMPKMQFDISPLVGAALCFILSNSLLMPLLHQGQLLSLPVPICLF